MKSYLYMWAVGLISLSAMSVADLDIDASPLQPMAGQAEMDVAYDMSEGDADLKAAQAYNQAQEGEGALSIQLNPALQFAQFALVLPSKAITELAAEQLKTQAQAFALWSSVFKFTSAASCELQRYEVKNLNADLNLSAQPLTETVITWILTCPELKSISSIEVGLLKTLAPQLHTMRIDWLTPDSLGLQKGTLPLTINPDQTSLK